MMKKCIYPVVLVVVLLHTKLFFEGNNVSKKVLTALNDVDIANIHIANITTMIEEDKEFLYSYEDVEALAKNETYFKSTPNDTKEAPLSAAAKESTSPSKEPTTKTEADPISVQKAAGRQPYISPPITPENLEKERLYYEHHYQEISKLVNESTILDWNRDRRRKGKYSQWLDHFDYHDLGDPNIANATKNFFRWDGTLCQPAKIFHDYRMKHPNASKPHILLARVNQDFGAFSSVVKGRMPRGNYKFLPKDWIREGCSEQFVMDYINHPDTLAVFTNQFQKWSNPKVISLPLGLQRSSSNHAGFIRQMRNYVPSKNRTQLLMVNSKGWSSRVVAINKIMRNFREAQYHGGVPRNTYNNYDYTACPFHPPSKHLLQCYYWEMSQSKFILSPSGLGVDCFRNWEAIYTGIIPVIERLHKNDGWFENTLAELPIAWVDDYKDATPEFLEREYDRIVHQTPPSVYKFEKMTRQYWIQMAFSILDKHKAKVEENAGNVEAVEQQQ